MKTNFLVLLPTVVGSSQAYYSLSCDATCNTYSGSHSICLNKMLEKNVERKAFVYIYMLYVDIPTVGYNNHGTGRWDRSAMLYCGFSLDFGALLNEYINIIKETFIFFFK